MSDLWVPVIAALGGSALTGMVAFGLEWWHSKRADKLLRVIAGEKWTQKQLDQWQEELRGLAEARRRLGVIARRETGIEVADLFAINESNPPIRPPRNKGTVRPVCPKP